MTATAAMTTSTAMDNNSKISSSSSSSSSRIRPKRKGGGGGGGGIRRGRMTVTAVVKAVLLPALSVLMVWCLLLLLLLLQLLPPQQEEERKIGGGGGGVHVHGLLSSPPPPRSSQVKVKTRLRLRLRPFSEFEFAPNGVCIQPSIFVEVDQVGTEEEEEEEEENSRTGGGGEGEQEETAISQPSSSSSTATTVTPPPPPKLFTMRNVPGDGDCMFLAVALASLTSLGLGANDYLLRAISQETRNVVAQILSQTGNNGQGKLYVSSGSGSKGGNGGKPTKVVVSTKALLEQATRELGLKDDDNTDQYLKLLRKQGRDGGLYGGGPELVVLSNVLRRPIAIYEPATAEYDDVAAVGTAGGSGSDDDSSSNNDNADYSADCYFPIVCKGVFGDGLFEDPCFALGKESAILKAASTTGGQPGAYSWKLHILILETGVMNTKDGRPEKHACVLLPQPPQPPQPPSSSSSAQPP